MKTIIFDIDGTLTNMWPIEKSVLMVMTKEKCEERIDALKKIGISETYKIFCSIVGERVDKKSYTVLYNESFATSLRLPMPEKYPLVSWIKRNHCKYMFVYATGGQRLETEYVLARFGIRDYFDTAHSINKNNCRFSKATGIPFRKIKRRYKDCIHITDSEADLLGAQKAGIPAFLMQREQKLLRLEEWLRNL